MQTVFLVDDDDQMRSLAARLLVARGFRVVGEASDGVGIVEKLRRATPQVVILDLDMPHIHGMDLVGPIVEAGYHVVVWTSERVEAVLKEVVRRGASALVPKTSSSELDAAIRLAVV